MKKILLLTISILMVTALFAKVKASNPIPSYNVLVTNESTFQETISVLSSYAPSDEKRQMNVTNEGSAGNGNGPVGGGSSIAVYIYRLDQSVKLGPFVIPAGETLTVPIDGYNWGVFTQTNNPTYISVWTNDKP
ncbi:MAG TPA: hypothetical protein VFE66_04575 [Bacteroidales bacterium]|nr:hypothetical protein [Bacteroidales bacterium]